jgi:hypothetical protein
VAYGPAMTPFFLLLACTPDPTDTVDTDPVDLDDAAPINHVVTVFHVADTDVGADLDGDGAVDNAIAPLGVALDALLAERFATNVHVVIVQLGDVDDWTADGSVRVGLFPAVDDDHDGSDNASGTEVFDGTGSVDANGEATTWGAAELVGGAYATVIDADTFQVGTIVFEPATGIHVAGKATDAGQTGTVALGVTTDAITTALTAENVDANVIALITGLADVDLDGDGAPETVSMAFTFDATRCEVSVEPD